MKVAFAGLGVMGFPMAGHLAKAGHDVAVYNRTPEKAAPWVAANRGRAGASAAGAAAGAWRGPGISRGGGGGIRRSFRGGPQGGGRGPGRGTTGESQGGGEFWIAAAGGMGGERIGAGGGRGPAATARRST